MNLGLGLGLSKSGGAPVPNELSLFAAAQRSESVYALWYNPHDTDTISGGTIQDQSSANNDGTVTGMTSGANTVNGNNVYTNNGTGEVAFTAPATLNGSDAGEIVMFFQWVGGTTANFSLGGDDTASGYVLLGESGSSDTAFISAKYGTPVIYDNGVLFEPTNRGDVYTRFADGNPHIIRIRIPQGFEDITQIGSNAAYGIDGYIGNIFATNRYLYEYEANAIQDYIAFVYDVSVTSFVGDSPLYYVDSNQEINDTVAWSSSIDSTRPSAIYVASENKTFFTYGSSSNFTDPTNAVSYYDHTLGQYGESHEYINPNTWTNADFHGAGSLAVTPLGRLLVFGGAHNVDMRIAASLPDCDISKFEQLPDIAGDYTYPYPFIDGNTIYLFMRKTDANRPQVLYIGTITEDASSISISWSAEQEVIEYTGGGERVYIGDAYWDGTDIVIWTTKSVSFDANRRDIFAYRYDTLTGDVSNFDETTTTANASLPVTNQVDYRIVETNTAARDTNLPAVLKDSLGNTQLVYVYGTGTDYEIRYQEYNGSSWSSPLTLSTSASNQFNIPHIVEYSDGRLHVMWFADREGIFDTVIGSSAQSGSLFQITKESGVWGSEQIVMDGLKYAMGELMTVKDGLDDFRFLMGEQTYNQNDQSQGVNRLRLWGYGDSGILQGNTFAFDYDQIAGLRMQEETFIDFDGASFQEIDSQYYDVAEGDNTTLLVGQVNGTGSDMFFLNGTAGGDTRYFISFDSGFAGSPAIRGNKNSLFTAAYGSITADTNKHAWGMVARDTSLNLIYDGTRYSSGSPTAGSVTVTDLEFGRLTHTNSSYLNGSIDIALIFDRNLTYNELNKIGAKLATDYGITWNDM